MILRHFWKRNFEFLEKRLADDAQHLTRSLDHLSKGRKQQIVIFLDNADQRSDDTQQQIFLIAQELAAKWPATVFVALRPETFHKSIRTGALSGYHPKAFTIAPPRVDHVIVKRLEFALRITGGDIPLRTPTSEMHVSLEHLDTITRAFLNSIQNFPPLVEGIDNLSAGNVRLALDLVKNFFGSGHVDTEKIVEIYRRTGSYTVPLHEFLRATIFGDGVHYDPQSRAPIANIFDVSETDPREHFLLPVLLGLLRGWTGVGGEEGFVELPITYEKLQGLGFRPEQIDWAIVRGHRHGLLETAAREKPSPGKDMPQTLRVTSVGAYHVLRLPSLFTYVDAMIIDTPILDDETRSGIDNVFDIQARLDRCDTFREYMDECWDVGTGTLEPYFDWATVSLALAEDVSRIRERITSN